MLAQHKATTARPHAKETVQVTYYPVLKNRALGQRMTRTVRADRGENPMRAAERALRRCYKVRDYLILEAHLAASANQPSLFDEAS